MVAAVVALLVLALYLAVRVHMLSDALDNTRRSLSRLDGELWGVKGYHGPYKQQRVDASGRVCEVGAHLASSDDLWELSRSVAELGGALGWWRVGGEVGAKWERIKKGGRK